MSIGALIYPFIFSIGLLAAYFLVPFSIAFAKVIGAIDYPSARRINKSPTPRTGGIAVFFGTQAGIAAYMLLGTSTPELAAGWLKDWWTGYLMATSALLVVGLVDDAISIRWHIKLCAQVCCAIIMYCCGVDVGNLLGFELPVVLNLALTVLWYIIFVNAINLIDGLDGLAAGLASVASCGLIGFALIRESQQEVLFLLAFLGATLGFLRFNFHPARIFLGDSGSMFIGFTLASFALASSTKGSTIAAVITPMLAIGVPLFDSLLAIWRRSIRACLTSECGGMLRYINQIATPDAEHLHHRLLRGGLTQRRAALLLYAFNGGLVCTVLLSAVLNSYSHGIYLFAFVAASYIIVGHLAKPELKESGQALIRGINRPSWTALRKSFLPVFDILALSGTVLALGSLDRPLTYSDSFSVGLVWCGITFTTLVFSPAYRVHWSKATVTQFVSVALASILGSTLALATAALIGGGLTSEMITFGLQFTSLGTLIIVAVRSIPALAAEHAGQVKHPPLASPSPTSNFEFSDNMILTLAQAKSALRQISNEINSSSPLRPARTEFGDLGDRVGKHLQLQYPYDSSISRG